jgi:SNF family Na+-dependent transporter
MILPVLDTFTSLFAGCVVFATLGYMSETSKLPIDDVVKQGIHFIYDMHEGPWS